MLDMSDADCAGDPEPRFLGDRLLMYGVDAAEPKATQRMMVFQGAVNGHQALVLLDLGANANFVSKEWAHRTGIAQRQLIKPTDVTTATGRTVAATSQLMSVDVRVVGKATKTSLVVVPLGTYDIILGTPWFAATKPHLTGLGGRAMDVRCTARVAAASADPVAVLVACSRWPSAPITRLV